MANNNDGQIVLGLDIPKTVSQINDDIKKLQGQLDQVKATGALDTSATVKQINAQIATLQAQLNNINIQANVNMNNSTKTSAQQTGQQIGKLISDSAEQAISRVSSPAIGRYFKIDPSTSNQFRTEMEKLVSEWTNAKGKLTDINIQTRTSYDKDADENITRLHQATVTYKNELDEVIKKTIAWRQIGTTTNAKGEEQVLRGFVEVAGQYSKSLDTASTKTDTFIDKRKKAVSDFEIDLQKIQSRVADQGVGKPIKDQTHIDALETQYNEVNLAIQRLNTSTKDTFTDTRIEVEKAIATLENLERQYRNAETTATSLRSKDIATVKSQYSSKLDVLVEKMQSSGVYSNGFQKGADNLRNVLGNATDSTGLTQFLNGLDKLEAGYKRAKASADAFNQSQKVGIKVSGLESSISDLQRISPEIDKFEADINGAKVTIKSLGEDLSKVSTQSDFSVVNEKWKAFTKAAQSAGIAISEVTTKSDSLTEKLNKIQLSFDNGHGDSEYKNRIQSLVNDFERYGLSVEEANQKTANLRTILDGFKIDGNFLPDDQLVAQADKLETEFKAVKVSLDSAKLSFDKFLQPVSSEKASSLIIRINDFLTKNTAITKEAKEEIQGYVRLLQSGNVNLSDWNKFDTRLKEINIEMREAGKLGKSLKQTLLDGAKSFAQWTFSSGMVMEVVQTVKTLTNNVIELDNKLLELVKVSDLTADGLEKATERAYKLGDTVGKTGTQVIGAVTEFKRAGYNMEESFDMAEAALVMTNVAEGITETSDAAGTLISVLKGFNMADSEAMSIVDMINATSNASPIGFDQLAEGLERTAGTLAQSGNTIQQTIGLLTAGYAQLRNVEKVSQGLITISARIRGVGEDGETIDGLSSKMSEDFGKIGVAVENADGSLRSIYQIAQDYSKVLPTLTDKQKQYYAELAAGKHQVTVWNSIVKQFKDAENATTQAINSVGSASEENQKYLDSISGKISIFNSSVEDLSNTLLNSNIIKFFIDLGTVGVKATDGLISSLDFLGGSLGTLATIGSGVLGAMGHGFVNYDNDSGWTTLLDKFKETSTITDEVESALEKLKVVNWQVVDSVDALKIQTGYATDDFYEFAKQADLSGDVLQQYKDYTANATTATAKFGAVLKSIGANLVIMLAISAAIKGITWVTDKLITTPEELSEAAKESINEYNSLQQEVSALDSELTNVRNRIEEIKNQGSLSFVEQEELSRLEKTNEELDREYKIKKKLAESSNTQAREDANNYFNQDRAMYGTDYGVRDTIWGKQVYTTEYGSGDQIDFATDKVLLYSKTLDDVKSKEQELLNLDPNSKEYESLNKEIELLRSQATSLNTEITSLFNEFTTNDDVLDPEMDEETIQRLSDFYNLLKDILNMGSGEDTTASFNEIWDSKEFESSRKELEKLARAGELTPETLKSVKNYDKLLDATDKSVEELIGHIKSLNESGSSTGSPFEATSISNTISILDAMADKWKAVNTLYNEFQENGVGKFSNEAMNEVVESFKEIEGVDVDSFLSVLSDSSSTVEEVQDAFDELATEYIFASNCLEGLTDATADQVVKELEAKGIANASAIVYDYLATQKQYAAATSRDLANASIYEVAQLINEGNVSEDVAKKIAGYVLQKELANGVSLSTDGDIENIKTLMKACGEGITAIIAFQNAKSGLMETMEAGLPKNLNPIDPIGNLELIEASAKAAKEYQELSEKAYAEVRTALANVSSNMKANTVSAPGTSSGSGDSSKSSKDQTPKEQEKYYDWLTRNLEKVQSANDKIRSQVDDENLSYQERLKLQSQLLENDREELATLQIANQRRVEGWEEAKKKILETFGTIQGNDLISKIQSGTSKEGEWYQAIIGEENQKVVDEAIDANDKLKESDEKLTNTQKQLAEDTQKEFEMRKNEIKSLIAEVETAIDSINSSISIRETSGSEIITEADYRSLIRQSKEQISLYEEQLDVLYKQRDSLEENSAEWYGIQSEIASVEASINDCKEAQAEWNEEIKKLPVKRIERYLELLENIKKDITNFQAEQDALGISATKEELQELISISKQQIDKLLEQHKLLQKNLETYTYGTDQFNDCNNQIQSVEDSISELIQQIREYNNQILQIPIDRIVELNEQLNNIKDAMSAISDDYDTTVNTVVDTINHEIDSLNELIEAEEKAAEDKINPLQEQLDLLEKQNEARSVQLSLEQAQYDLERAKNQKTNRVIRDGEIQYEEDQSAVRDAEQNLADKQLEKTKWEIQTQISDIEEARDKMIEGYNEEIDRLTKISEKWEEIKNNIEDSMNAATATEILGKGWLDKVLSGNDKDIYDRFVKEFTDIETQKALYEKQIQENERVSGLMQQYIDAFNNGSMSYEEAVKQFNALRVAAKDGFSSKEYLDAQLGITGSKDTSTAIKDVQNDVLKSYFDFRSYLDVVNKNTNTIASYTSTWEQIRDAVVEQLETLKKLAEEEAKKVANATSSSGGRKHSSGGGSSTKWDSRDENNGPGREINDRAAGITSSSSSSSSSSSPSGPASDPDLKARKRKSGIETGIVGKGTSNSNAETVRMLALDKLKSDEEPAILHRGEVVLNEVQMKNIVDNFRTALIHPINLPQVTIPNITRQQPNITIEMKDFNFNEVDNVRDFCDEMQRNFDPIMTQYFSKKFK